MEKERKRGIRSERKIKSTHKCKRMREKEKETENKLHNA
jgi:hypothetical protein